MVSEVIKSADILQSLAFDEVAGNGLRHGRCRLSTIEAGSWQADVLRDAQDVVVVKTPDALRAAMIGSSVFIFIPVDAMLDDASISRILSDSVSQKTLIVEKPEGEKGG